MAAKRVSRRQLLAGLGAAAASAPFWPSLLRAQPATAPRRLVIFFSPNEPIDKSHWEPGGTGRERPLTGLNPLMESLEPHRGRILMLGDLRNRVKDAESHRGGHVGIGHLLTGRLVKPWDRVETESDFWASGISVDQHIAQQLGTEALTLGVQCRGRNGNSRMSYLGVDRPVDPIENASSAFASVFGGGLPADELADLRVQRRSVLDFVAGRLGRLRDRMPASEALRVEHHLEEVRGLERRLAEAAAVTCSPEAPSGDGDLPQKARQQIDVMVNALACAGTRVATLQLGNSGGAENYSGGLSWPSVGIDYPKSQHVIAHDYNEASDDATARSRRRAVEKVYYDLFAHLLDRLAETPDAEGTTLLDNTFVLYAKNIGRNHTGHPMMFLLAGGNAHGLRTGRYLSFGEESHSNLLASLCNLMGDPRASFGDPEHCTGPLAL